MSKRWIIAALTIITGCGLYERDKQIKTIVYIQSLAARLEDYRNRTGKFATAVDAHHTLDAVNAAVMHGATLSSTTRLIALMSSCRPKVTALSSQLTRVAIFL